MAKYIQLLIMVLVFTGCTDHQQEESQKIMPTITPTVATPNEIVTTTSETAALPTPIISADNDDAETDARFVTNTIQWRGIDSGYNGTTVYYNNGDIVRTSEITKE